MFQYKIINTAAGPGLTPRGKGCVLGSVPISEALKICPGPPIDADNDGDDCRPLRFIVEARIGFNVRSVPGPTDS